MGQWDGWERASIDRAGRVKAPIQHPEGDLHRAVVKWARSDDTLALWPELATLYHPANGEARDARTGKMMVALGVKRGISDLVLPVPKLDDDGAFIPQMMVELKAPGKLNNTSDSQKEWESWCRSLHIRYHILDNYEQVVAAFIDYLTLRDPWTQAAT